MPRAGGGITTRTRPAWMEANRWKRVAWIAAADFFGFARALLKRLERKEDRARVRCIGKGRTREASEVDRVRNV